MIDSMPGALLRKCTLVAALIFAIAAPANAQEDEGGVTWEEAPAAPAEAAAAPDAESTFTEPVEADAQYADTDPSALTDFDPALRPYGRWRDDPTYGRVWIPNRDVVGPDFAPYVTSGHWALTADNQWIWVSDYPFGWVVFHYGRWVWIQNVGWAWIPGRQYAHAWVVWRVPEPGYYYVGWAPMPPDYIWVNGVAVGVGFGVYYSWVFCPSSHVFHHHVHSYIVHDHHHVHYIAGHTHRWRPPRGHPRYHGPPPQRAHVPAHAMPRTRTAANPKAVAASRPPNGGTAQRMRPTPTGRTLQNPRGGAAPGRTVRPVPRGSRSLGAGLTPARPRPSPSTSAPVRTAPPPAYAPPSRSAPPPNYGAPGRAMPAPGYAPPSRSAPPPRYSPPNRSAPPPRYTPPPSKSSPPPSRSAPPPRYSPPSRSGPPPTFRPSPPPSRGGGRGRR